MRRKICEVTDPKEIERILASTNVGRLSTNGSDGYPYITPVNFVHFNKCIYFHTALKGEKLNNISRDPKVCFEVDIPLSYIESGFNPHNDPCRTHQFFHCVIIRGKAQMISDEKLKVTALTALVEKHEGKTDFKPILKSDLHKGCGVVEIVPEHMTAKSDIGQGRKYNKLAAEKMVKRGLQHDLETIREMGYDYELDPTTKKYRLKD